MLIRRVIQMDTIMLGAGFAALLFVPLFAYTVVWASKRVRQSSSGRPEPPQVNQTDRTIPGGSGRTDD